ncbi:dNA polymerase III delta subunit [Clostridium sp. CAG:230]|nr:dNA polymerase III delta subunit [Clostridium sp. CAG:230]
MVSVSETARKAMHERKTPIASFYANLLTFETYYEDMHFPYTQPISDIYGLRAALEDVDRDTNRFFAVELNAMSDQETLQFVAVHLGKAGKKIRQNTAQYFLEQVDNSLLNIQNELEKLIAYTMGREEITKEDIDAVCSIQVTGQIFKMLDAVAGGKKAEAIRLYHDLLELKENPMSILYLLTRHFNILLQIKSCKQSGKGELAKKIGIPPFSVGKYQMQAKHFTQENLKEMLTACIDTEYDFKRGNINDQIGVELLLTSFVQQAG